MIDAFLHWLGFGLCHQLPERSFFGAGGHQLPVCARDTGIYLGFMASLAVMALLDRGRRRSGMPPARALVLGALGVAAMAWDGVTSYAGVRGTTNDIRLATGLATGFALTLVVVPIVNEQLWRRRSGDRVLGEWWETLVWLAAVPVTFAVVRWIAPALGVVYALATGIAIIATFTTVNLIVALLAPRFEQKAARLRDAWMPILLALGLTVVEIGLTGWLRAALVSLTTR